jgi:hypothetical protein
MSHCSWPLISLFLSRTRSCQWTYPSTLRVHNLYPRAQRLVFGEASKVDGPKGRTLCNADSGELIVYTDSKVRTDALYRETNHRKGKGLPKKPAQASAKQSSAQTSQPSPTTQPTAKHLDVTMTDASPTKPPAGPPMLLLPPPSWQTTIDLAESGRPMQQESVFQSLSCFPRSNS